MGDLAEITVHELVISKEQLLVAPERERLFFILLGHFSNEIMILNKALMSTVRSEERTDAVGKARAVQAVLFAKLLIAKMFEGWDKVFQKVFFQSKLRSEYEPRLNKNATDALGELGRFFANSKHVAAIRNDFTFHYPDKKLIDAMASIPNDEDWRIYLSEARGNSLYYVSEMIAGRALASEIGDDVLTGLDRLIGDCINLTPKFLTLVEGCMGVFIDQHVRARLSDENAITLKVPSVKDVRLPYFTAM